jgi:energy-coupling factor transporter ATP-binding protein EcfA2
MTAKAVTADMLRSLIDDLSAVSKAGAASAPKLVAPRPAQSITKALMGTRPIPETEAEIQKLRSALAVLSPDAMRGQGKLYEPGETKPSDNYWLMVVWGIASLGWDCGEDVAREWSGQSVRYTDDGFNKAWNDFDPTRPDAVGIGSLYKLAQDHGWAAAPAPAEPVAANDSKYKLLSVAEVRALPLLVWLVKGLLPLVGLAALFGPSGSGKSFLALHLAGCIATGRKWFDMRVQQAPVVYVMLEGEGAIRNRISALEVAYGPLPMTGFSVVVQQFVLTEPQDVADLAAALPRNSVVFIDTLNRAAPTSDENSSKEMGVILQGAKELQAIIGGLVVLVHHTGKDTTRGMRGHSSLHAALDGAIEVERDAKNNRAWSVAKAKDGEDGKRVAFKLVRHVLGTDADGDEISSCSVAFDSSAIFTKPAPSGSNQKSVLKAVKSALSGSQASTGKGGCPAGTPCLKFEDAVAAGAASLTTTDKKRRNNVAKSTITSLVDRGLLGSGLDSAGDAWCWLA